MLLCFQTTYENFRYRSDGRPNVYDQGCLSNFQEVVFAKIQPSKHKFRAHIQEEVQAPPANDAGEVEDELVGGPRAKVGDDLDIDGDLLKISQRHNHGDIDIEMGGGNTNSMDDQFQTTNFKAIQMHRYTVRSKAQHSG